MRSSVCLRLAHLLTLFAVCSVEVAGKQLRFVLHWLTMDYKARCIELALLAGDNAFRCGPCGCGASAWDTDVSLEFPERSVQQVAELYFGSLLETLDAIREGEARGSVLRSLRRPSGCTG